MTTLLLLIHGGLWQEHIGAEAFWRRPGIVAGLQRHGFEVLAPDRRDRPPDWTAEVDHLAVVLPDLPVTVVAGSNGCSAAVRLALALPHSVNRLVLAWPVTTHNPVGETRLRSRLAELGASPSVIRALLNGQTLRGVTDNELATINMPVGVIPWVPENPSHQRHTVDALLGVLPDVVELPGCPHPVHPDFPPHADAFAKTVAEFAGSMKPK